MIPDCPEFNVNRYFCDDCNEEYHNHRPTRISDEVESRVKQWYEFNDEVVATLDSANIRYEDVKYLVKFLDNIGQTVDGCRALVT